jgi:5-methyltetrahydropteroyltriglutamate--homocysteine methyltransferase
VCIGPLKYVGQAAVQHDIANLKAALVGQSVEGYLPAIAPGTIEHWLRIEHYPNDEAFLFAIADVMHGEYKAITDAGLSRFRDAMPRHRPGARRPPRRPPTVRR